MFEGLLKGRSVVITGAGSGVGRAASDLFAHHGARLICADVQEEWLAETVSLVTSAGGEARAVRCDVARRADVQAAVAAAVEAYGRLDVMYNNAGVASPSSDGGRMAKFVDNTDEQMDRLIAINMRGVMYGCQAAIAQFRAQGGGGVIVNTASVAGMIGWGGVLYSSTKGAVVNMARALAMEVAAENIRVNNVCPGTMITRFGAGARGPLPDNVVENMAKLQPLGRVVDPMDAANAALFLASDMSVNITGLNLPVDGGLSAGR
ncbi:SDR family NAD(P)-dependent oxidoreductase [Phenylobacterium sp.]|jgi:NAD(P)-dependent dehydrogenase (short-subunit alcohol dehydrogenase family)|uniref:SDR family NAD(P)-dependent oxidoreductase n=1 Tax=Phenylobacterium sp. TaxID=1871053 RepID=UPI002F4187CB